MGDAGSRVRDAESGGPGSGLGAGTHDNRAALRCQLNGIGEQVYEHAADLLLVRPYGRQAPGQISAQRDLLVARKLAHPLDGPRGERCRGEHTRMDRRGCFQARQREQVLGHTDEVLGLVPNAARKGQRDVGILEGAGLQRVDQQLDRGEGRAQLVRDVGHEVAARRFQARRPGPGALQLGLQVVRVSALGVQATEQPPRGHGTRRGGGQGQDKEEQEGGHGMVTSACVCASAGSRSSNR